ncbi:MAG: hypothetical protein JRF72_07725 [Deltaproteobacteria bacterium]|jgi:hypothetical protein|nr:hypothetical protein [Deltaproteobacteria bacterium]
MADSRKITPDFFEDSDPDPVETATGPPENSPNRTSGSARTPGPAPSAKAGRLTNPQAATGSAVAKKKAGFYLSADILNRFNLKFYELKLSGAPIDNKSNLLELMLGFALDDMDKGEQSRILHRNNMV